MIFKSMSDITHYIMSLDEDEVGMHKELVVDCIKVYRKAYDEAPDHIIGVGRITYAEDRLIDYQKNRV